MCKKYINMRCRENKFSLIGKNGYNFHKEFDKRDVKMTIPGFLDLELIEQRNLHIPTLIVFLDPLQEFPANMDID